jgi:hypothetical protein
MRFKQTSSKRKCMPVLHEVTGRRVNAGIAGTGYVKIQAAVDREGLSGPCFYPKEYALFRYMRPFIICGRRPW